MSTASHTYQYQSVIDDICALRWDDLTRDDLVNVAWAYSYFSVQFRENLEVACLLYPNDEKLQQLKLEECATDNLSPWPNVAVAGEKLNHDEFMKRLLALEPIDNERRRRLSRSGEAYLDRARSFPDEVKALTIASYEEEGLKNVFRAILRAPRWDTPLLAAFRHFLEKHIEFDSDPDKGHGALCRHLMPDDRILPIWTGFRQLFLEAAPAVRSG
jgi:hypothetical protein